MYIREQSLKTFSIPRTGPSPQGVPQKTLWLSWIELPTSNRRVVGSSPTRVKRDNRDMICSYQE